jgi:hypothetical protein
MARPGRRSWLGSAGNLRIVRLPLRLSEGAASQNRRAVRTLGASLRSASKCRLMYSLLFVLRTRGDPGPLTRNSAPLWAPAGTPLPGAARSGRRCKAVVQQTKWVPAQTTDFLNNFVRRTSSFLSGSTILCRVKTKRQIKISALSQATERSWLNSSVRGRARRVGGQHHFGC